MKLSQRLGQPASGQSVHDSSHDMAAIAQRLHKQILDRLDLAQVGALSPAELRAGLRRLVDALAAEEGLTISADEATSLAEQVVAELVGNGPLEALLSDSAVSDVMVNGFDKVYVERAGKIELTRIRFRDNAHLLHTISRMAARVGRRIDESSPMVDARLPDGSRVNAIIPPLAIDGPSLSIRRFGSGPLAPEQLVAAGAMSRDMLDYLATAVRSRCSILIAGGTGAGKTTLLNMLSGYISDGERLITIEDAAELRLAQGHVIRLESRPPNLEGKGEVTIRELVRNALRMRPDRIVIGEVRGAEVMDMLQAMNTGHEGSMATIHANNARDALSRLTTMLAMAGSGLAEETMATLIARSVHVVVHIARMSDGRRRISEIAEVVGQSGSAIQIERKFSFERSGVTSDGSLLGYFLDHGETRLGDRFRTASGHGEAAGEISTSAPDRGRR